MFASTHETTLRILIEGQKGLGVWCYVGVLNVERTYDCAMLFLNGADVAIYCTCTVLRYRYVVDYNTEAHRGRVQYGTYVPRHEKTPHRSVDFYVPVRTPTGTQTHHHYFDFLYEPENK